MAKRARDIRRRHGWFAVPLMVAALFTLVAAWQLERTELGVIRVQAAAGLDQVRLSEVQNHNVLTLPSAEGNGPAWIELENAGESDVSLLGLCLTRDSKLTHTLVFPDITLEAGGYLLVYADGLGVTDADGVLHAPFRLPKGGGHELYLYDAAQHLLDSVSLSDTQADEALCRDASGAWVITAAPTPGSANRLAEGRQASTQAGEVALNEVMSANPLVFEDENGETHDYVEVVNRTDHPVDLEGYYLSDSAARPNKWRFPGVTLPAGGVLAVHCSGVDRREDPAHLHAPFKLSRGETVYLSEPQGVMVSSVTLPRLGAGQALSWQGERGWGTDLPPTPNRENTLEAALEADGENRARRAGSVWISEVSAASERSGRDWVELVNDADSPMDLSGWWLSDRLDHPRKWQFPQGTVLPGKGFIGVRLTGAGGTTSTDGLSAPFALGEDGGDVICLADPSGQVADALFMPVQYPGVSFGRDTSGRCGYFQTPTPGAPNGAQALLGAAPSPSFSHPGGLFATGERFEVTLSAPADARIYYTLDCSDPDETKTLYAGERIPVSGTTILRARAYREDYLPSVAGACSYLFDVNAASEAPYVVSLVSDPEGLYSDETGIMVMGPNAEAKFPHGDYGRGANFWMDWEREAHVELFTGAGEQALSQTCGIKLHGRKTRAYELKSFKVMARSRYGGDRFQYPIFSDRPWDEYEAFILRYSGQDYKYTFMRDVLMSRLTANTSVMYMDAEPCIVYLNGSYYSAMYIRENISPFSLARREGWTGQEASVDLVKSGYEVKQGSNDSWLALKEYLDTHDNNTAEAYERIDREVDIDNYIEYATLCCVFCPPDTVNIKRYRNPDADGKWRWVLYDFDRGLRGGNSSINGFELMAQGTTGQLFRALMRNDTLRERFLANLDEALATYLSSRSMREAAEAQYGRIEPLLPDYLANLGLSMSKYRDSMKNLLTNIRTRPARVLAQCAETFGFSEEEMHRRFAGAYAAIEADGA
ncbi:MAG: lamin tail domain-containing protein [Clostridia bacterium]|nr:lamin tail domain-containing protein [Clostridia bacterium]